jgi:hypothetical protein
MGNDFFGKPISVYTDEQAVDDGILYDISKYGGWLNIATTNLLQSCSYLNEDGTFNVPNLMDLIAQARQIILRDEKRDDWFYSGRIELPSGKKQEIFICQNGTTLPNERNMTIMLPEDY